MKPITERQRQVVELIFLGLPNKLIAHELGLSEATIKVHVRQLFVIFDVTNRTELAHVYGVRKGKEEMTFDERLKKLEAWTRGPYDFDHLIKRIEALEGKTSHMFRVGGNPPDLTDKDF